MKKGPVFFIHSVLAIRNITRKPQIFAARLQPSQAASTAYMYVVMRCLSVLLSVTFMYQNW